MGTQWSWLWEPSDTKNLQRGGLVFAAGSPAGDLYLLKLPTCGPERFKAKGMKGKEFGLVSNIYVNGWNEICRITPSPSCCISETISKMLGIA